MGVSVEDAVARLVPLGIDAIGFNCGKATLDDYIALTDQFISAINASGNSVKLLAEPNAGLPEIVDTEAVYKVTPDEYAAAIEKISAAGASIIGGCCGTTPEHIKAAADALK
jgi:5-methyltetrahydrofolate--homocysteine methyltransferase